MTMSRIRNHFLFLLALLFFSLQQHTQTVAAASSSVHYSNAFQTSIAPAATWPCSSSSSSQKQQQQNIASISSTEMEVECDSASIVVAAYSGTVYRINNNNNDDNDSIVLRHSFGDESVHTTTSSSSATTSATTTKTWYTRYQNVLVDSDIAVGDVVTAGQELGSTEKSFNFQVMVGASCTLEWARQHPLDGCNRKGYDPMVHPLILFHSDSHRKKNDDAMISTISMDTLLPISIDLEQHGVVQVTMTPRPTLQRFVIEIIDHNDNNNNNNKKTIELTDTQVGSFQKVGEDEWIVPLVVPYTWLLQQNASSSSSSSSTVRLSAYDMNNELVGQELLVG